MAEQVLWVDAVQASGQDMRRVTAAGMTPSGTVLAARTGVRPGELAVSANGVPNMSVNVAAGQCFVQHTAAGGGQSVLTSDAVKNVAIAASDATNPRRDLIVFRVYDETNAVGNRKGQIEVVTGAPAVGPADPAVPANSIVLARVTVAANAASITNANITDLRAATVSLGGITPSAGAADVAGAYDGQYRDNLTTGLLERFSAARNAWEVARGTTVLHEQYTITAVGTGTGIVSTAYPWARDAANQIGGTGRVTVTTATGQVAISNPTARDEVWQASVVMSMPAQNAGRGFVDLRSTAAGVGTVLDRRPLHVEDVGGAAAQLRVPAGGSANLFVGMLQSTGATQNVTGRLILTRVETA